MDIYNNRNKAEKGPHVQVVNGGIFECCGSWYLGWSWFSDLLENVIILDRDIYAGVGLVF